MNSGPRNDSNCWITDALSQFESRLVRYVIGFVGDVNIAREIVQETFLRLCSKDQEKVGPHLASWLFRVSRNAAIDHLRKEKRMQTTDFNSIDQLVTSNQVDPIVKEETVDSVNDQLQQLPPSQQEVIRLRFENQLSYKQIAEVTGHSTSNVGFMIHTAIKKIRNAMAIKPYQAELGR